MTVLRVMRAILIGMIFTVLSCIGCGAAPPPTTADDDTAIKAPIQIQKILVDSTYPPAILQLAIEATEAWGLKVAVASMDPVEMAQIHEPSDVLIYNRSPGINGGHTDFLDGMATITVDRWFADLQTLEHELGHAMGLAHAACNKSSVMGENFRCAASNVTSADIEKLCVKWDCQIR